MSAVIFSMSPKWSMGVVAGWHHELTISFWREERKVVRIIFFLPIPPYHQWLLGLVHRDYHLSVVCLQLCVSWPDPGARALEKNPTAGQGQKSCRDNCMVWIMRGTLFDGRKGRIEALSESLYFLQFPSYCVEESNNVLVKREVFSNIGSYQERDPQLSECLIQSHRWQIL